MKMKVSLSLFAIAVMAMAATSITSAFDPGPLQDFCVATDDINDGVFVNGKFCKDPRKVKAEDFVFSGLNKPAITNNTVGSNVTTGFVDKFPGLNTLGVGIGRIDFAPNGTNPPHVHPRATEIFIVIEGTLYAGFVSSNQNENQFFSKVLHAGDVIVFPVGLVHFQFNIGKTNALAFAMFNSQNPGLATVANTVFGSNPRINPEVLAKSFQLDVEMVKELQEKVWIYNSN